MFHRLPFLTEAALSQLLVTAILMALLITSNYSSSLAAAPLHYIQAEGGIKSASVSNPFLWLFELLLENFTTKLAEYILEIR
jgi:hypothetical protein